MGRSGTFHSSVTQTETQILIWCNCPISRGLGWKRFLQTSPQGTTLVLVLLGGLSISVNFITVSGPETHPCRGVYKCLSRNPDGHWISSENWHCCLLEVTVKANLFACLLWNPPAVASSTDTRLLHLYSKCFLNEIRHVFEAKSLPANSLVWHKFS